MGNRKLTVKAEFLTLLISCGVVKFIGIGLMSSVVENKSMATDSFGLVDMKAARSCLDDVRQRLARFL